MTEEICKRTWSLHPGKCKHEKSQHTGPEGQCQAYTGEGIGPNGCCGCHGLCECQGFL
jgi:hypothetical protein